MEVLVSQIGKSIRILFSFFFLFLFSDQMRYQHHTGALNESFNTKQQLQQQRRTRGQLNMGRIGINCTCHELHVPLIFFSMK